MRRTSISSVKRHCRSLKYNSLYPTSPKVIDFDRVKFSSEETSNLSHPHHDALVISIFILNYLIKRTLINNGSSTNMIFASILKNMQIPNSEIVHKVTTLIGFSGEPMQT